MAVSRYDNPARYTPVDDYVKYPVEYVQAAMAVKQKQYDEMDALGDVPIKAINDIVTLDQVRTNTNNTETTTAVDKKMKQEYLSKLNTDIDALKESVNGDITSSDYKRKLKSIVQDAQSFKNDFGTKAKARYDNYNATIKGVDENKADPAALQQGIFNQVNQSLGMDYSDINKTYTSKSNEYINEAKSIAERMSLAKQSITDSLALVGDDSSKLDQLAKDNNIKLDLGGRTGVVTMGLKKAAFEKGMIEKLKQGWLSEIGNGLRDSRLMANQYASGKNLTQEEANAMSKNIIDGYSTMFDAGDYQTIDKLASFNADPVGRKSGYDENGAETAIGGTSGENHSNNIDTGGNPIISTVNTIETKIAGIQKENKILDVKLKEYKSVQESRVKNGKQVDNSIVNAIQSKIDSNKKEIANQALVARTAINTVIETNLPEIAGRLNALTYNKSFSQALSKSGNSKDAISSWINYDKSGRVGKKEVKQITNIDDLKRFDELMKKDSFKNFYIDWTGKKAIERLGENNKNNNGKENNIFDSMKNNGTQDKIEFIKNMKNFENDLKEESNGIIQKYEANTTSDYLFFGDINEKKPSKEQNKLQKVANDIFKIVPELGNYTIDKEYKQSAGFERKIPVESITIGSNGKDFFYNVTSKDKDNNLTTEKVVLNKIPEQLLRETLVNAYNYNELNPGTQDALEQKSNVIRLQYPSLNKLLLKGNGTTVKNLKSVIGKENTEQLSQLRINSITIQQNPLDKEGKESLYSINGTTTTLTYQELCAIIFDMHIKNHPELIKQNK